MGTSGNIDWDHEGLYVLYEIFINTLFIYGLFDVTKFDMYGPFHVLHKIK